MSEKFQPHNFTQNGEILKSHLPQGRVSLENVVPKINFGEEIQIRLPSSSSREK